MDIKERLVEVTTRLIKEKQGNPDQITVREIAKRANVGVGTLNYHFQSKDNLIEICVQKIIKETIGNSKPNMDGLSPIEKLKKSVKIPVDFLMQNPDVSRISILDDFINGQPGDNSFRTLEKYYSYAKSLDLNEDDYFRTVLLLHGLQGVFLRWRLYREKFDFSDKAKRDVLIDGLIDKLFGGREIE